ncbi:MAG: ABC transporter permease [Calditrichaeota bacterium]|nr:MAG: ABC transporter permease [Calditrichota bacterium]
MSKRIRALMQKEFIHIIRDPRSLAIIFLLPILMVLLYGYAINFDIRDIKIAVLDQDQSSTSRSLAEYLTSSGYFLVSSNIMDRDEIEDLFLDRRVQAVLIIPPGFSKQNQRDSADGVQIIIDGSNANTATVAINYLRLALLQYSTSQNLNAAGISIPFQIEPRIWYNPDLKSTHFIVPGLISIILMMVCAMLTSVTIARERETGTMEQIFISPIRPIEIIVGKLFPYVGIALLDAAGVLLFSYLIFNVPFRGSILLFFALTVVFIYASLSIGLLISTKAKTQQVAMLMSMVATILPSILLSGFIYAIASIPRVLQLISYIVPAKYFLIIDRGIILKGIGFSLLVEPTLFLFIFGSLLLLISLKNFKTRLEG